MWQLDNFIIIIDEIISPSIYSVHWIFHVIHVLATKKSRRPRVQSTCGRIACKWGRCPTSAAKSSTLKIINPLAVVESAWRRSHHGLELPLVQNGKDVMSVVATHVCTLIHGLSIIRLVQPSVKTGIVSSQTDTPSRNTHNQQEEKNSKLSRRYKVMGTARFSFQTFRRQKGYKVQQNGIWLKALFVLSYLYLITWYDEVHISKTKNKSEHECESRDRPHRNAYKGLSKRGYTQHSDINRLCSE